MLGVGHSTFISQRIYVSFDHIIFCLLLYCLLSMKRNQRYILQQEQLAEDVQVPPCLLPIYFNKLYWVIIYIQQNATIWLVPWVLTNGPIWVPTMATEINSIIITHFSVNPLHPSSAHWSALCNYRLIWLF